MRILSRPSFASTAPVMASLFMAALAPAAHAGAANLYYERSVAVAAHSQCNLFEPRVAAALNAATLQARGAALRSGLEAQALAASSARARLRVEALSCEDADLKRMASRVEAGFAGWSRAARISFPGDKSVWRGDRFRSKDEAWRLVQEGLVGRSNVQVGLIGRSPSLTQMSSVVSFLGVNRPYAARLVMRNPQMVARPWLSGDGLPPASGRSSYFATGVKAADRGLLKADLRQGERWTFSESATEALSKLDPRESFHIEFLFHDDSVAVARFEVGDFAAGKAFLAMGAI